MGKSLEKEAVLIVAVDQTVNAVLMENAVRMETRNKFRRYRRKLDLEMKEYTNKDTNIWHLTVPCCPALPYILKFHHYSSDIVCINPCDDTDEYVRLQKSARKLPLTN
uniref:Uncharacterized protein n=1 Tax=Cacopsylla melanoneura TaxID=428564 RepID=A0A8D8WXB4_9HEMI